MKSSGPTPHEGESRCSYLSTTAQVQNALLKKSPSCFDLCCQGGLWTAKEHLFGWCSNDWHTHPKIGCSGHPWGRSKVQQLKYSVQTSAPSHQPSLRCRFIPSYILFTTVHVAAWGFLSISECPEFQMQEQHAIPSTRCIFQDWKSKATILCHLHDCGLESAEHS